MQSTESIVLRAGVGVPRLSELQQAIFLLKWRRVSASRDLVLKYVASIARRVHGPHFSHITTNVLGKYEAGDEASADECAKKFYALNKVDCVYPYARQC